ncbi:MAG TPA: single-stranded-DNA-specific exonuclease RecJ [Pirellulaceae bacterium]|nr:single-stranded-DNA-specific exonuclease RecJ [Pirellulaceae bacterium]
MTTALHGRTNKRWRFVPHDAERISRLERLAGLPPIVAQLLLSRGVYEPESARTFLDCKLTGLRDPEELPGASAAADRIHAAVRERRKIVVYGDYDADGMTGTAILLSCLKLLGAEVSYYVPNRLEEGYGLNCDALRSLAERGASLVVSVDCGIASIEEAALAKELGLELIITDHHEFGLQLPEAAAIVHPRLPGTSYPFGGLCGAGVALKLAWAICQRASQAKRVSEPLRNFLLSAVGLAAIGTVADVVPLLDENRIIVRHGLNSLKYSPPLGLAELMRVAKLSEKPLLDSEDIGFTIGPRLNAAGRFGQAQLAVELLTTESTDRAQQLAEYIHELNSSRESLERSIQLAAAKQIKEQFDPDGDAALVLAGRGWHAGVIGLVAGRLAEKYHRPVVLISLDQLGIKPGIGSARSPNGLNLHAALAACSEHLAGFGGHACAAGLRIDERHVDSFRAAFCEHAGSESNGAERIGEIRIDAEAPFCQLTAETVQQIQALSPFGCGNPRPVLCATGVKLAEPPKRIGANERHLALKLVQQRTGIRGVCFGGGEWHDELAASSAPLDVAYKPVINEFRGRRSVEVQLVDWRISEAAR